MLATGGKFVHLWSLSASNPFSQINLPKPPINDMCFTFDNRQLLVGGESEILTRIDIYSGEKQSIGTNLPRISKIACSSDGHFVAAGSKSGPIAIFGEERLISRAHRVGITALVYARNSSTLIAGDKNGLISMGTNKRTKLPNWSSTRYGSVYDISGAKHSDMIAVACKSGLIIYDLVQTSIVGAQKFRSRSICYSPFSDNLIAISGEKSDLLFYDPRSNVVVNTVQFESPVVSLDFRFDGITVGAAVQGAGVKLLDIRQLDKIQDMICDDEIATICFQQQLLDEPISSELVTLQSEPPQLSGWPRPLSPRKDVIENEEPEKPAEPEKPEEEELDLDKIRTELQAIEQDVLAHEPTLSPRNAAFLQAARDLRKRKTANVFELTQLEQASSIQERKSKTKQRETTNETNEMIKIICGAYRDAMEDMQDEMNQVMNNVHLDILKRISDLKRQIAELQ